MMRSAIDRASQAAQLLGALLCGLLGLRLMVLAIGEAHARRAPAPLAGVHSAEALVSGASGASVRARRAAAPERSSAGGPSLRLMLSVVAGPERSEVYVNGSLLGLSPYLGDYTCKQGEELRIEVVPEHQALISRFATCEGQTLWIR